MCSRGKNIRVKENPENKRSKWKQAATIRKGWVAPKAGRAWLPAGRPSSQAAPRKEEPAGSPVISFTAPP